jgi:hypothetical protein
MMAELVAGRELDLRVAGTVFGWADIEGATYLRSFVGGVDEDDYTGVVPATGGRAFVPKYTTDAALTPELMAKLAALNGYNVGLVYCLETDTWWTDVSRGGAQVAVEHPTANLALAGALLALAGERNASGETARR